jgi:hypothetical protein
MALVTATQMFLFLDEDISEFIFESILLDTPMISTS